MPDLATHLLVPALPVTLRRRFVHWPLFLLGNILPDLFGRSFNYLFKSWSPFVGDVTAPFHSMVVVPLYAYAVSLLFAVDIRIRAFRLLITGAYLHMGLDILQTHVGTGNLLFFPFYHGKAEIPLFWPEQSLYVVPVLMVVLVFVLLWKKRRVRSGGDRG